MVLDWHRFTLSREAGLRPPSSETVGAVPSKFVAVDSIMRASRSTQLLLDGRLLALRARIALYLADQGLLDRASLGRKPRVSGLTADDRCRKKGVLRRPNAENKRLAPALNPCAAGVTRCDPQLRTGDASSLWQPKPRSTRQQTTMIRRARPLRPTRAGPIVHGPRKSQSPPARPRIRVPAALGRRAQPDRSSALDHPALFLS
jgi:hypothetical protein